MHVLDRIVELHLAVPAAHDYDRDLALEFHEALDDGRPPAKLFQRRERLFLAADERLPLAVIAEAPGLQDRGQLHMRQRIAQALLVMHVGVIGDRDAEPAHEVLLNETVLSDGERIGRRIDRSLFPGDFERAGRHVLELAGDHVTPAAKVLSAASSSKDPTVQDAATSKAGALGSSE